MSNTPGTDRNEEAIQRAMALGQAGAQQAVDQHYENASLAGARYIKTGMLVTRNLASSAIAIDHTGLVVNQPAVAVPATQPTVITPTAQTTTSASATTATATSRAASVRHSLVSVWGWAILAAVVAFIVLLVLWNFLAKLALGDGSWATNTWSLVLIPLALAVGIALVVAGWRYQRTERVYNIDPRDLEAALRNNANANASASANGTPTLTVVQSPATPAQQPQPTATPWNPHPDPAERPVA